MNLGVDPTKAPSHPYITGNSFKYVCRHVLDEDGSYVQKHAENNFHFVKTDFIDQFWSNPPSEDFVLFTHNSDHSVGPGYIAQLNHPKLAKWYAQNVAFHHPKLIPIPIGIANRRWPWGDVDALQRAAKEPLERNVPVYANYSLNTNKAERMACKLETKVPIDRQQDFGSYLRHLKSAYFVLSPKGNGIDCHRTWEALYMGAIPITTVSPMAEFYKDLPIIFLSDWKQCSNLQLTEEVYHRLWRDVDLRFDAFIASLEMY